MIRLMIRKFVERFFCFELSAQLKQHFKIVVFTRRLIPRHLSAPYSVFETLPLSTQEVCLNIVNCFTDATREGWKRKKHRPTACSSRPDSLQLTREQSRVRFTDAIASSMKNDSKRDRFIVGPYFFLSREKKERKRRRGRKKEINASESILCGRGETYPHVSRRWWLFIEIIHVLLLWKSYQGIESLRQHSSCFFTFKRKSNIILLKEGLNERERKRVKLLIKTEEVSQREGRLTPGTPRHRQVFAFSRCFSQSVRLSIIFLVVFPLPPPPLSLFPSRNVHLYYY